MRMRWTFLLCLYLMNVTFILADSTSRASMAGAAGELPLKETKVDLNITGSVVHAVVNQIFINNSQEFMEAVYTFPLPAGAIVTDMTLETSSQVIRSVVKEKANAVAVYQAAKGSGRAAALVEKQVGNLFTTSIANIEPGGEVAIQFSYVEELPFDGYGYAMTFPTTFGPRHSIPAPLRHGDGDCQIDVPVEQTNDPQWAMPEVLEFTDHFLKMNIYVSGLPVRDIFSTTHDIWVDEVDDEIYQVSLNQDMVLTDRDFALKLDLWEGTAPRVTVLRSEDPDGAHGMLSVFPPMADDPSLKVTPREVVFILDTSGSMQGDPLEQAKAGLTECLAMLRPGDRFNIIRFSHDFDTFSPDFLDANHKNLATADIFVNNLHSGGGTWMKGPLRHALQMKGKTDHMRVVVFLTDGDTGNSGELFQLVERDMGAARLFTFGVGAAPNEFLLRKLSEMGSGVANFINTDEDVGDVMSNFFSTINAPVLTDVEVRFVDESGQEFSDLTVFPAKAPDVFRDRPLQLTFHQETARNGLVLISGMLGGQQVEYEYPLVNTSAEELTGIRHFFGQSLVNEQMAAWYETSNSETRSAIRDEVVSTALDYQLVTRFTARVATSELRTRPSDRLVETSKMAVAKKFNSQPTQAFAATADGDFARMMFGLLLLAGSLFAMMLAWYGADLRRRKAVVVVKEGC